MSWQAIGLAYQTGDGLDPSAKAVYVALAYHANHEGRAWPFIATLVAETGNSDRTVRRALKRLEDLGCIRVVHRSHRSLMVSLCAVTVTGYTRSPRPVEPVTVTGYRGHSDRENYKEPQMNRAAALHPDGRGGAGWTEPVDTLVTQTARQRARDALNGKAHG